MLEGFKKFILRGNVVDMAVGVVVGAAVVGKPDFSSIGFTIASTPFPVGDFINAVVSFLLIAAAIYFFVVTPVNALMPLMHKYVPAGAPTTKKCPECLSDIPIEARRCAHCAQPVAGRAA